MQSASFLQNDSYEVLVRKGDLDDYDELSALIAGEGDESIQLLYYYPKILSLFERSFLSVTILDTQNNIIGCAVFDDSPQGVSGMVDFEHENMWEKWLPDAWKIEETIGELCPYNTLWMTFLILGKKKYKLSPEAQVQIIQKVFQNVYGTLSGVNGILFLKRGEALECEQGELELCLQDLFFQVDRKEGTLLQRIQGISGNCEIYYSPASTCTPQLLIRMAREEDHDDLAEIFNRQSDVHTQEFGEFFIADMIATQNQTRRLARNNRSDGKALVGQVGEKAIGLMSISSEIDYRLLGQCFELETFDNLYKSEYMDAIRERLEQLEIEKGVKKEVSEVRKRQGLLQESMRCHMIGQRLYLQQFCFDKEQEVKLQIDNFLTSEEQAKTLTTEFVREMMNGWLQGYQVFRPSGLFLEYPELCGQLECLIQKPLEILLETLEYFGLPRNYMQGEGHWKDWAKKIMEEKKAASLRKPKKQAKTTRKKAKKDDEKKDDELKPPPWFDLSPFLQAFTKFTSVSAEQRTTFRRQVEQHMKTIVMLFCNGDGEMIPTRHVDLIQFGEVLKTQGLDIPAMVNENLAQMMECFGGLECDDRIIQVMRDESAAANNPKLQQQKTKEAPLKKVGDQQEQAKPVDVLQKMASFEEFKCALYNMKIYDQMMCRLGLVKSNILNDELKDIINQEEQSIQRILDTSSNTNTNTTGQYKEYVSKIISIDELPEVPKDAQNAIVINLFCIDEVYESRSLDFVEYAFELFPSRDYIILTQPYTVSETTLLQNFVQVQRRNNSTFEHVLYIFHRDALSAQLISVHKSIPSDIPQCESLIESLNNGESIMKTINQSLNDGNKSDLQCFTVMCDSTVIGIYTLSKIVNLQYLTSHFCIQDHIILKEHPIHLHTKLLHAVLNPLFFKQTRFILREICRLMQRTCIYFEVHNRTMLPDIFNEFVYVRARAFPHFLKKEWDFQLQPQQLERQGQLLGLDAHRQPFDQQDPPFSLAILTKKLLSSNKVNNNTRILVVGPSDTGISFIESLLTIKDINFNNIILLAPGGLITMHVTTQFQQLRAQSTNYTLEELKALMVDARVTVIDAKMVKLDKKNNRILIDRNAYIPFDLLICTVGLIDTELQSRGLISYGLAASPYYKDKKYYNGVYSIDDPYLYQHFKSPTKLTRTKKPSNITIYGNTLHTIAFISGLLNRGVQPHRIYYVMPPRTYQKQTQFRSNKERLEYEDHIINDPLQFESPEAETKLFQTLIALGVHVSRGFNLFNLETAQEGFGANSLEALSKVVFRKKADDFEQTQALIEMKKQEIIERMQNSEQSKHQEEYEEGEEGENAENTLEKEVERLEGRLFDYLEVDCRYLITSGLVDIDKEIFNIIHENGLVYNGRLIVKSNFQTTQSNIFACGKICEFSQRYKHHSVGKSLRLDKYNGRELGQKLSKCILDQLELSYLTSQTYSVDELPQLYMPIGQGGILPQGLYYYHIRKNDYAKPKILYQKESATRQLLSDNFVDGKGHFLQFNIDANGMIESGDEAVHSPSLIQFIELSTKYLNRLEKRFESGLIENVSEFLSENWAMGLYHEWFSEFRHITKSEMLKHELIDQLLEKAQHYARDGNYFDENFHEEIKKLVSKDIIESIQDSTIEFIRENFNHLPMYYVPQKKQS